MSVMMIQKKFGLSYKGKLLGFYATSNGEQEFADDITFKLDSNNSQSWLVDTIEQAEKVANTNTEWYNAGYDTPVNDYVGKCKVVEIEMYWTE